MAKIPLEAAVAIARAAAAAPRIGEEPLLQGLGRLLAADLCAPIAQPPFTRSALDGYALRAADLAQASPQQPQTLKIIDKIYAGQVSPARVGPGQAVRLMTGCAIPAGADAVIRQEDCQAQGETVRVFARVAPGANCCRQGEEYRQGQQLLARGCRLDAAALAVAAGAGFTSLPLYRRPRIALLSSGDEICQPGSALGPGQIYDGNSTYLRARLLHWGIDIQRHLVVKDDLPQLVAAYAEAGDCDILISTGGVSVGEKDLTAQAVQAFGAKLLFHGVAIKPGMPTLLAQKGEQLLLGLSGNPFSAAVAFELLLRPILAVSCADASLLPTAGSAITANGFAKSSPCRRLLRARYQDGQLYLPPAQANGQLLSMVGCNCLADIPAGSGPVQPGERLALWRL